MKGHLQILLCVALFLVTLCIYRPHYDAQARIPGGYESYNLAYSMAHHGAFANPFRGVTGPSAHLAPTYPALVALLMRCLRTDATVMFAVGWIQAMAFAFQLSLFPLLAHRLGMGFGTGILASLAWLAAPISLIMEEETGLAGALAILAAYCMHGLRQKPTSIQVATVGVLWGAVLLTSPVAVLVLLVYWVGIWTRAEMTINRKLALVLLPAVIVLPWAVRNYSIFHQFVFVRDNLGLELAVSNNSCASFSLESNIDSRCFYDQHPLDSVQQALLVRQLGEVKYNQMRMHEAIDWIRENPLRFSQLTLQRFLAFWFPVGSSSYETPRAAIVIDCMTFFSIPGLILLWRKNRSGAESCLLWLIFFPVIYYFVQYSSRYRQPILWVTLLLGAFAIRWLALSLWRAARAEVAIASKTASADKSTSRRAAR